MSGNGKYTLMRNSERVNQPFRSPLRPARSPHGKNTDISEVLLTLDLKTPPKALITPEKRSLRHPQLSVKKIRLEGKYITSGVENSGSGGATDIQTLKNRIHTKRQRLENLKLQLLYKKKHNLEDLKSLTERWLRGCQEALIQFQKDMSSSSNQSVSMSEILSQLKIPPEVVKYSEEDDDFV